MGALGLLLGKLLTGLAGLFTAIFGELDEDLTEAWPVLLMAALILWSQRQDSRKKPRRRPGPIEPPKETQEEHRPARDLGFEIPPLAGAPREGSEPDHAGDGSGAGTVVFTEGSADRESLSAVNQYQRYMEEKAQREHSSHRVENAASPSRDDGAGPAAARTALPPLTPAALRNAVLYAEILGQPRCRRRKGR